MCRRACAVLLVALTVGLALTRRRLSQAEAELRLLRVAARAYGTSPTGAASSESEIARTPVTTSRAGSPAESRPADFSEWDQAVPPMDS